MLRKVLLSQQPERFKKAQAFISVQGLQPDSVAQLITSTVLDGLQASSQDRETGNNLDYLYFLSIFEIIQLLQCTTLILGRGLLGLALMICNNSLYRNIGYIRMLNLSRMRGGKNPILSFI